MKHDYLNPLCVKCHNYVCKAYKGECMKYRLIQFIRKLFKSNT